MSSQPAPRFGPPRSLRAHSRIWWSAALALAAAIAGAAVWYYRVPAIETAIVQPFADQTGQPWLSAAITDDIVAALRPVTKPDGDSARTAVLEGVVTRAGDRFRVSVTLRRPDGRRYWTRTFHGAAADIPYDVAMAVVPRVRRVAIRHRSAARVYEQFLEARQQFKLREFVKAAEALERITDADPAFGLGWAWLAIAREHVADQGAGRPNDLLPGARDAAERAVTLEPDLADPHTALGIVKLQYDWDWEAARRELDRALALSPGDPLAARWRERWVEATTGAPPPVVDLPAVPRDPDSARRLLAEADDLREQTYIPAAALVLAATVAKDTDSLFRWLEAAYDERSAQLPYLLRNPALPLSDPRVVELIRRLKLPTTTP